MVPDYTRAGFSTTALKKTDQSNNEPVTLQNGAELLGLLQKHGYNFRIDLAEAASHCNRQNHLVLISTNANRATHDAFGISELLKPVSASTQPARHARVAVTH